MLNIKIKHVKSSVCFVVLAMYLVPRFLINFANATYRGNCSSCDVNYAYNIPPAVVSTPASPVVVRHHPVYEIAPMQNYEPGYVQTNRFIGSSSYRPHPIEIWEGPYLGVLLGMNENNAQIIHENHVSDLKNSDIGLGLMGGVNFQSDSLVYGMEADTLFPITSHSDESISIKGNFKADLRTRFGVAIGRWLPYAFVGLGTDYTTIKDQWKDGSNFKNFHFNYSYGAGADFRLSNGLFAKIEASINQTSRQTANLDVYHIHFKDKSYGLHLAIAEKI